MTISELQQYSGATNDGAARFYAVRGEHHVTAWTGPVAGSDGWWWALTRQAGAHEVVVAMGWSMGGVRARDIDIARALLPRASERAS
jgi:hypothetical protein